MTKPIAAHGDFETRSLVDLKRFGLDIYARHPSTEALCFAWCIGQGQINIWKRGDEFPEELRSHLASGGKFAGHNVLFEWYIWNFVMKPRYGWPTLKLSQLDCTMARGYAMSFPASLDRLSKALGIEQRKDTQGASVMKKMCKPRRIEEDGTVVWWETEHMLETLYQYCIQDVATERACDDVLLPLSDTEWAVWQLDLRINTRGVAIDRDAAQATMKLIERARIKLDREMMLATGGQITKVNQAKRLLEWCKVSGVEVNSLKKSDMKALLEDPDLPYEVREVLEIRSNSAKISITKLETMLDMSLFDGRVRGMFQYHGASTGRWAGRGVQLHNLPRPEPQWSDPQFQAWFIDNIAKGTVDEEFIEMWSGPIMRVVSSCIRGYLSAEPNKKLIGADLANIEGRMLAWLAGEEWKLEAFRAYDAKTGHDLYKLAAARIYKVRPEDVTSEQRQIGKVSELSMGYQGGVGAFQQMAVNYLVTVPDEQADEIKVAWREANPAIKQYWYDVEKAAISAVRNAGAKYYAGAKGRQVCFLVADDVLLCRLPSGRCLSYPYPRLEKVPTAWGEDKLSVTFMTIDSRLKSKTKGKWTRLSTYGGKLVENITQAASRDVLAEGMLRIEEHDYPIVLHVHDEIVSQVDVGFGSVTEYEELMSVVPTWATGLPVAAEGFEGQRYRK